MIRLAGVSAQAGSFHLSDVSFSLEQGEWGVVLGPAGAGKTTLLETIAGVRRCDAGVVMLDEMDMSHAAPESRNVGMVYQHGLLFPHLGVEENVMYGARDRGSASEVARRFGANALYGRPVDSLSGGERQIVALARALAAAPGVVLLDEPFTALDPRRRRRIRAELKNLCSERQVTVLHVTHDFDEARSLGDVAMVMSEGRVLQSDAPARLFERPASKEVAEFLDVADP